MKNSRQHAQRLRKLHKGLKRAHSKIEPVNHEDPIDALIYGVVSERMSASAAETAMKRLRRTFINWNDLRVSRAEEIVEAIGDDSPRGRAMALTVTTALRSVFDIHHTVSLQSLKKLGKRPARQTVEKLDGISRFTVDYCMLTSLQAHAVPLTEPMLEYLKRHDIVDAQAEQAEIEGFLTRHVAAKSAYEFYALLRQECECPRMDDKKKRKRAPRKTRRTTKAK